MPTGLIFYLFTNPAFFAIAAVTLILALTVHEAAHAWAADKLGDPTARLSGRKTLNPLKHLDPIGTLLILVAGFGWAKPVPVDPYNLREERKDNALIAIAGPATNLIFAIILGVLANVVFREVDLIYEVFRYCATVNIALALFNLIPIPPLDGSRVYRGVFPESFEPVWDFLERYGMFVLIFLVFFSDGLLSRIIGPGITTIMNAIGF